MYILLVPVYGLFARKRVGVRVWGCIALAVAGLFLLCIDLSKLSGKQVVMTVKLCDADLYSVKFDK